MCDVDNLNLNYQELLQEITTLLSTSAESSDANALLLNQELQHRLELVRKRMQELLKLVRARYARNEEILIRRQKPRFSHIGADGCLTENIDKTGAVLRGGTFRFKGNLYFRDVDGRSCPNNADYDSRCNTEMFPTDFDMRSKHVWTVLDKRNVVMGIKQQLLDHITYQPKAKSLTGNKRKRKNIDLHVLTLATLLEKADSSFSIDWLQISTIDVEYRHSSYSCEAMWLVYLNPQLKREEWTTQEDDALLDAARANNLQNWQAIAAAVHQRSDYQCFVRMQTTLRFHLDPTNSFKWGQKENERLRKIVLQNTTNGVTNWSLVTEHFPGKSKSTLIGRYMYVLHPSISHEPFTPKEDLMLYAAVEEYNGKFNCFPRTLFPNRSLAQLRTRYHNVLAQRNKTDPWSVEDDTRLMTFVTKNGTSQWVNCANHLGNHTRTSCRTRFLVIKRFLEQHPDAIVADIPRRKSIKSAQVNAENWTQRLQEWQEDPDSLIEPTSQRRSSKRVKRVSSSICTAIKPLRGIDIDIYEYFKYAYNLNLKTDAASVRLPEDAHNLSLVTNVLRFRPTEETAKFIQTACLPRRLTRCYNKMLRQLPHSNGCESEQALLLLPPNWSTMMGFRAICILSMQCRNKQEEEATAKAKSSTHESHPALQLFRQRLRSLFYNTTLLSRLEPSVFEQLPTALTELPRMALTELPSTAICADVPAKQAEPTLQQQISQALAQKLARRQIEDLDKLKTLRRNVIPESVDCKKEPNVKEEEFFE